MTDAAPTAPPLDPGLWGLLGQPDVMRRLAGAGPGWLCLDSQHGLFDRAAIAATLAALPAGGPPVAVRVSQLDDAEIGHALDAGARRVIVPMVETVEQAARAAAAAAYPPHGRRSWGPIAPLHSRAAPAAADAPLDAVWIMVETAVALEAVEELAAVPGVAGLFVGPFDLALALGTTVDALLAAPDSPLRRIAAAARAAGVVAGAFAGDPDRGASLNALGFGPVAVGSDTGALDLGAATLLGRGARVGGY